MTAPNQEAPCDAPHETGLCTVHQLPPTPDTTDAELRKAILIELDVITDNMFADGIKNKDLTDLLRYVMSLIHSHTDTLLERVIGEDEIEDIDLSKSAKSRWGVRARNRVRAEQRQRAAIWLGKENV